MRADLRAKRPLLYQEVVNALYQIIDTSNLKPGDQMPAERELMEQLGVSRNVLREAFHILEQRGIITSQQGKGRFLREIPISQLGEDKQEEMSKNLERYSLYEAYEVRQVLETKAMDSMLLRFAETNTTTGEFELHQLYAKKTGSVFMEQTLNIVLSTILEMMHTTSHNVMDMHQVEEEKADHRRIIDALHKRDSSAAQQAMYDHIQHTLDILQ